MGIPMFKLRSKNLSSSLWESINIFNIKNIIIILLNYQPFIQFNVIIDIISSFLIDEDKVKIIIYYSIACRIMIPCHSLCTTYTDLHNIDNDIDLLSNRIIYRYEKFLDRKYKMLELSCKNPICIHIGSYPLNKIILISKYIENTTNKLIELLNNKI